MQESWQQTDRYNDPCVSETVEQTRVLDHTHQHHPTADLYVTNVHTLYQVDLLNSIN
jgi:hypothetical protein